MIRYQAFPALDHADEDGLLAMGGDLSVDTLVSAYAQGIFPWFNEGQPILWWSPDPRLVLYPSRIKISKSLKKSLRAKYQVTCNQAFERVITGCALRGSTPNMIPEATWITEQMHSAYMELHKAGYAHSIETWSNGELMGGLYGVSLGKTFFGESMFSRAADASKVALAFLCQHLLNGDFKVIDCQVASDHLFTLGAEEISRKNFVSQLVDINIQQPNKHFARDFPKAFEDLMPLFSKTAFT